jgi:hypothetical protein
VLTFKKNSVSKRLSLKIHYKNCDFCDRHDNKIVVNKNLKGRLLCSSEECPDKPHKILKIVISLIIRSSPHCLMDDTLRTTAVWIIVFKWWHRWFCIFCRGIQDASDSCTRLHMNYGIMRLLMLHYLFAWNSIWQFNCLNVTR